jgi:hypothetical protein
MCVANGKGVDRFPPVRVLVIDASLLPSTSESLHRAQHPVSRARVRKAIGILLILSLSSKLCAYLRISVLGRPASVGNSQCCALTAWTQVLSQGQRAGMAMILKEPKAKLIHHLLVLLVLVLCRSPRWHLAKAQYLTATRTCRRYRSLCSRNLRVFHSRFLLLLLLRHAIQWGCLLSMPIAQEIQRRTTSILLHGTILTSILLGQ